MFGTTRKERIEQEEKKSAARETAEQEKAESDIIFNATQLKALKNNVAYQWLWEQVKNEIQASSERLFSRVESDLTVDKIVSDRVVGASVSGYIMGLGFTEKKIKSIIEQADRIIKEREELKINENENE